ncbi:MAG: hypothetical protein Q7K35_00670 [bacterium]|nr:hypothetical protein [bacterium]
MKKALALSSLLFGLVFLAGCQQPTTNDNQPKLKIIWKSQAKGDYVADNRDPESVCKIVQTDNNMNNCNLLLSKSSADKTECADGMSVAGCFACKFECDK